LPPGRKLRVLQVAAVDITVSALLRPLIDRLTSEGYEVESVCRDGKFSQEMRADGYVIHSLATSRSMGPLSLARQFWDIYRLVSRNRYDIVHVHTPIAAGVGRLATALARTPVVIYTAHGFYFHDGMKPSVYRTTVWAERMLGRMTDMLLTQSAEDAQSAVTERICPPEKVQWISNGVDVRRFRADGDKPAARRAFGIGANDAVVGFLGRMVREKGILELLEAMKSVSASVDNLTLLICGDNSVAKDRDRETQALVTRYLDSSDRPYRVVFTGFIREVDRMMQAIDVFCLPSHREGMPRSIIEAMASGRPVVATDIRGCREEVQNGETGLLVPARDPQALAGALTRLLSNPSMARQMGLKGRERAVAHFDEQFVLDRQVAVYNRLSASKLAAGPLRSTTAAGAD
jgi:glycosyltransferase involved in cell wall biosynthesis